MGRCLIKRLEDARRVCYKIVTLHPGPYTDREHHFEEGAMTYREIKAKNLNPKKFIDEKVREIREMAGDGIAISALSGGVDSSVVTNRRERYFGKLSSKGARGGCLTVKDLPGGFPEKSLHFMEITCCSITSRSRDTGDYELELTWMPCPLHTRREGFIFSGIQKKKLREDGAG